MVYYAYFHLIIAYGLLFWGNSSHRIEVFRLQKKMIRIVMEARSRDSCTELFKISGLLPLMTQYIHTITVYIVNNKEYFM
jgi:hypothetical protein